MAYDPSYASVPKAAVAYISTANTGIAQTSSPTGITDLFTPGSAGGRIEDISITFAGTSTAGMVRFWFFDGTNYTMIREVYVSPITPSGTVPAFSTTLSNLGWCLQSGWKLCVSTNNAEAVAVIVTRAGDF
jgi:hypothetical protein